MTKLADRGAEQAHFDGNGQAMCAMTDAEVAEAEVADAMRRTAESFAALGRVFAEAGFTAEQIERPLTYGRRCNLEPVVVKPNVYRQVLDFSGQIDAEIRCADNA